MREQLAFNKDPDYLKRAIQTLPAGTVSIQTLPAGTVSADCLGNLNLTSVPMSTDPVVDTLDSQRKISWVEHVEAPGLCFIKPKDIGLLPYVQTSLKFYETEARRFVLQYLEHESLS